MVLPAPTTPLEQPTARVIPTESVMIRSWRAPDSLALGCPGFVSIISTGSRVIGGSDSFPSHLHLR